MVALFALDYSVVLVRNKSIVLGVVDCCCCREPSSALLCTTTNRQEHVRSIPTAHNETKLVGQALSGNSTESPLDEHDEHDPSFRQSECW